MLKRMRDASPEGVKPTLAVFIGAIAENDANLWPVNTVLMSNDYLERLESYVVIGKNPWTYSTTWERMRSSFKNMRKRIHSCPIKGRELSWPSLTTY